MKPTKIGDVTIIHDPEQRFGLDEMYLHVRVNQDERNNIQIRRVWLATFDEVQRMEARAERGLELLPDEKRTLNAEGIFISGCVLGVAVTCLASLLGKLL